MVSQLEQIRNMRTCLENALVPPPNGEDACEYCKKFYKYLTDEDVLYIRQLPPDLQQEIIRMNLKEGLDMFNDNIKDLEDQIGDGTELLEEHPDDAYEELPLAIASACGDHGIGEVLKWLGDPPVSIERINAKSSGRGESTLLHEASAEGSLRFMQLLLQYGANQDAVQCTGFSPLMVVTCFKHLNSAGALLLEWGADKEIISSDGEKAIDIARDEGNMELVNLLGSPLGGRRCELVGLQSRSDLNGQTCAVGRYFPGLDRYAVRIGEQDNDDGDNELFVKVKSVNLKQRDRTPKDPGFMVEFLGFDPETKNNKWTVCLT